MSARRIGKEKLWVCIYITYAVTFSSSAPFEYSADDSHAPAPNWFQGEMYCIQMKVYSRLQNSLAIINFPNLVLTHKSFISNTSSCEINHCLRVIYDGDTKVSGEFYIHIPLNSLKSCNDFWQPSWHQRS
jgi:hypothetical protein